MKKIGISIIFLFSALIGQACPVCERQQPRLLRGLIHGTGPEQQTDLIILVLMIMVVLVTLYFSVKWLIKPGEKSVNHIKRMVLDQEDYDGKE